MSAKRVLAFDFGASSGRAIIGTFDGKTIKLEEIHRFENTPVKMNGTLYWDLPRLFHEVKQGLVKAADSGGFDSLAVDTWGVDFGLIGKDGHILELPVNYRDERTKGMLDESFKLIDKQQFYKITGNQFMEINTAFQLLSLKHKRPDFLRNAETMLLMPDLFNYLFTGKKRAELSIASTTQLLNAVNKDWSDTVLRALCIPRIMLPQICMPGTEVGMLTDEICEELNIPKAKVMSVCGHDTQSAVAAAPTQEDDFIFISCGTWSLFGTEVDEPVINETSAALNITNEIGYGGKPHSLKILSVCGLFRSPAVSLNVTETTIPLQTLKSLRWKQSRSNALSTLTHLSLFLWATFLIVCRNTAKKQVRLSPPPLAKLCAVFTRALHLNTVRHLTKSSSAQERITAEFTLWAAEQRTVCFVR